MISQSVRLSQDFTKSSQILGLHYQISPFSSSPNTHNMQESDHFSYKAISIYDSIKQSNKFKSTKVNKARLGNKLEFA